MPPGRPRRRVLARLLVEGLLHAVVATGGIRLLTRPGVGYHPGSITNTPEERRMSKRTKNMATAAALMMAVPSAALAGSFAVMSYNVRGIPSPPIEDRTAQIAAIAPLLEDFHTPGPPYAGIAGFVGLQELFDAGYYSTLTNPATITYPYLTVKDAGGPLGTGDGLNMLSDFQVDDFARTQWANCFGTGADNGSDCDTNKGFTFGRVLLEAGVSVDVYTLHADAGQDAGSQDARRKNIIQLLGAINTNSPEGTPVIVLGDTNSLYTRNGTDNLQDLVFGAGLTDVWVQMRRSGLVPSAGDPIDGDCDTDPGSINCELVDKILFRDGSLLVFAPQSYAVLDQMFSDGQGNDLSDHYPVAVTFDYATVTTTTTTTVSTSTSSTSSTVFVTTTTMMPARPCGDPVGALPLEGQPRAVAASDALYVLKAAVGSVSCPLCTCDVDNSTRVTATDALRVLKVAVGQNLTLNCPACS
jgi:hypothetical protein